MRLHSDIYLSYNPVLSQTYLHASADGLGKPDPYSVMPFSCLLEFINMCYLCLDIE